MAGCGEWSQDVILNQTSRIFPFKTAIVCGSRIMIFHSNKQNHHQIMLQTNSLVTSFTLNYVEDIAFWTDSKTIYSSPINKSINTKVIKLFFILIFYYDYIFFFLDIHNNRR